MKQLIEKLLGKLGYILISKHQLLKPTGTTHLTAYDSANARGKAGLGLDHLLKSTHQLKWLEVGTGGNNQDGFDKIDIIDFPEGKEPANYKKLNIVQCSDDELSKLGTYNFVRMQHVFEHFTPEDGLKVLNNCSKILEKDGYILISCPDIDKVIQHYLNGTIRALNGSWGIERIGEGAPDSFYFSIFCHSVLHEPHLWCYNAEGIVYQLNRSGQYHHIEVLDLANQKSAIPFTHNRPEQDVVVIAQKK